MGTLRQEKVSELLRRDPRFKVTTTRTKDTDLPLSERSEIAKNVQADLFVSIHVNSSYSSRLRGFEIYFQNQLLPSEEALFLAYKENMSQQLYRSNEHALEAEKKGDVAQILDDLKKSHDMHLSRKLASIIRAHWLEKYPTRHHVIRQAPFRVLSTVPMPSILVELGYISHKKESKWMAKSETQKKMAYILYNGLIDYKETLDKKHLQRHIVSHAQK